MDAIGTASVEAALHQTVQDAVANAGQVAVELVLEVVERHKDKSFAPGGVRARSLEAAIQGRLLQVGVKKENEHKIEGLYEATKYHLEDMRKMLKLTR